MDRMDFYCSFFLYPVHPYILLFLLWFRQFLGFQDLGFDADESAKINATV